MRFMAWFTVVSTGLSMLIMPIVLVAITTGGGDAYTYPAPPAPLWFPPSLTIVELFGPAIIAAMLYMLRRDEDARISGLSRRTKAHGGDPAAVYKDGDWKKMVD